MNELVAFLAARLDEDEAAAKAAASEHLEAWSPVRALAHQQARVVDVDGMPVAGTELYSVAAHVARHDPARVLREVAAKRAILARHYEEAAECMGCYLGRGNRELWPCPEVLAVAAIWQDHPDYRSEWKP